MKPEIPEDWKYRVRRDRRGNMHVDTVIEGKRWQHHVHSQAAFARWSELMAARELIKLPNGECACDLSAGQVIERDGRICLLFGAFTSEIADARFASLAPTNYSPRRTASTAGNNSRAAFDFTTYPLAGMLNAASTISGARFSLTKESWTPKKPSISASPLQFR